MVWVLVAGIACVAVGVLVMRRPRRRTEGGDVGYIGSYGGGDSESVSGSDFRGGGDFSGGGGDFGGGGASGSWGGDAGSDGGGGGGDGGGGGGD